MQNQANTNNDYVIIMSRTRFGVNLQSIVP